MKGEEQTKNNTSDPRLENLSSGGSFAEIAKAKEARKADRQLLDRLVRKTKDDKAHIVIGIILLVIAAIFLVLSWRYNNLKERIFVPLSMQFITSCTCFGFGLGFTSWGIVGLILHNKKIKKMKEEA